MSLIKTFYTHFLIQDIHFIQCIHQRNFLFLLFSRHFLRSAVSKLLLILCWIRNKRQALNKEIIVLWNLVLMLDKLADVCPLNMTDGLHTLDLWRSLQSSTSFHVRMLLDVMAFLLLHHTVCDLRRQTPIRTTAHYFSCFCDFMKFFLCVFLHENTHFLCFSTFFWLGKCLSLFKMTDVKQTHYEIYVICVCYICMLMDVFLKIRALNLIRIFKMSWISKYKILKC